MKSSKNYTCTHVAEFINTVLWAIEDLSEPKINASERQVMPNVGRHGIEEKLISEFPLS